MGSSPAKRATFHRSPLHDPDITGMGRPFSDQGDPPPIYQLTAVAQVRSQRERRWDVAHAIGHHVRHPANQLWLRSQTLLAEPNERQAKAFAYGLLVDETEALREGLTEAWQDFGVPDEMVWVQGRLV